ERLGWGAAALVGAAVAVAAPGNVVRMKEGLAGRFSPAIEVIAQEAANLKPRRQECFTKGGTASPSCMYGGSRLRAILIGDSHADAVTTGLAAAVRNTTDGIMDWSYVSCPTLLGVKNLSPMYRPDEKCGDFLSWMVKKLTDVPKDIPLVIVNRTAVYAVGHNELWEQDTNVPMVYFSQPYTSATPAFLAEFARHLTDTACQLAADRPVYLVRPIPEMGINVPKTMSRAMSWGQHKEISISLADYHQRHAFVWAAQDAARDQCGVKILDPLPYLCWDGRCHGAKNGRPLYYDDDHLSEYGNKLLVPMFAEVFQSPGKSASGHVHNQIGIAE
ncbi:MAG: acyltransferase, partial [Betaproteobacteria bacterium]|nr:acyltransferase [Betaproteobacteria bacterium]